MTKACQSVGSAAPAPGPDDGVVEEPDSRSFDNFIRDRAQNNKEASRIAPQMDTGTAIIAALGRVVVLPPAPSADADADTDEEAEGVIDGNTVGAGEVTLSAA